MKSYCKEFRADGQYEFSPEELGSLLSAGFRIYIKGYARVPV